MIRQTFSSNNPHKIAKEVSEFLGCPATFITPSFGEHRLPDTKHTRTRYFEHYQQKHATIVVDRNMSEVLDQWLQNVRHYPPSEIFYQQSGQKSEKAEKRCKIICEELYRFSFPEGEENLLGELHASYRELHVLWIMGFDDIKPECIINASTKFLKYAKAVCAALENMHKKDQQLNEYYKSWKVKYQDISTEIYNLTKDYK